uniref:Transmembrane protein n=1 Tax=Chromera velia CCMP2878 TaxID=1169474 RepID=A0A0G4G7Z4_9ALVE|eukprot:Cvel_20592.t1-p1 / transcript=Cvel_20592.t1 / gene=Cvel_20592 / organism=Chromera_velia_CCMP2878 / gene_product=hypothetical protein / transcript_product=hypothetical protein / location=Cvel_scaffold1861:28418-29986(-) / protein_length=523 / sequence_SO=supercontig / SO=protein_coding / is_pseudo=false
MAKRSCSEQKASRGELPVPTAAERDVRVESPLDREWKVLFRPANWPLTYVWLFLALVGYLTEHRDLEGIAVVLTVKLNLSWYATRLVHPDIFDRLLQFWVGGAYRGERKAPERRVPPPGETFWRLFLFSGDACIHSIPAILHLYFRLDRWRWYHVVIEYVFVSRLYCLNLEGMLFCTGRQLNSIYSVALEADVFNTFYTCEQICLAGSLLFSLKDFLPPSLLLSFGDLQVSIPVLSFLFMTGFSVLGALSLLIFTHQSSSPRLHSIGSFLCKVTGVELVVERLLGLQMKEEGDSRFYEGLLNEVRENRQKRKRRKLIERHWQRKQVQSEGKEEQTGKVSESTIIAKKSVHAEMGKEKEIRLCQPLSPTDPDGEIARELLLLGHTDSRETVATDSPPSPTSPLSLSLSESITGPFFSSSPSRKPHRQQQQEEVTERKEEENEMSLRAQIAEEELRVLQDAWRLRGTGWWASWRLPARVWDPVRHALVRERAEVLRRVRGKGWKEYALNVNPVIAESWSFSQWRM